MVKEATVAGAGIWGCTVARVLADAGYHVVLLDERDEIGGNCASEDVMGIDVHKYGSHIFHTSDEDVYRFVSRFAELNGYRHHVWSRHGGRMYPLPFGLALVNSFFGTDMSPSEAKKFMDDGENRRRLFDAFIRGYTCKQWGKPPEEVDPSVLSRLPVRWTYCTDYFDDRYQGVPAAGYADMFRRMTDSDGIETVLSYRFTEYDVRGTVFYSGPLDRLFGYRFGRLPWRSLRFETSVAETGDFQGTAVVNYPDPDVEFTRIHEFRHYRSGGPSDRTVIMREYPVKWEPDMEPYYPVGSDESAKMQRAYAEEAARHDGLVTGGRLGSYRYMDMDDTVADALRTASDFLKRR